MVKLDFFNTTKNEPKTARFQNRSPRAWSEPRPRFAGAQSFSNRPRQSFSRPPTPFRPRNKASEFGFMGSLNTHKNDGNKHESLDKGLFFVKDPETHLKFLIDTGSQRSVLLCWRPDGHPTTTRYSKAANGSNVPVYECVDLELSLNMNRIFAWKFCKARVQFPILGKDFLKHYGEIINTSNGTLNCVAEMTHSGSNNGADAPAVESNTNEFWNAVFGQEIEPDWSLERLVYRYSKLFDLECFKQPPRHHTKHYIRTKGPSVCGQVRKLSPEK